MPFPGGDVLGWGFLWLGWYTSSHVEHVLRGVVLVITGVDNSLRFVGVVALCVVLVSWVGGVGV